jgi:hypothetical protein
MKTITRRDALLALGAAATSATAMAATSAPGTVSPVRSTLRTPSAGDQPLLLLDESVARPEAGTSAFRAAGIRTAPAGTAEAAVVALRAELVRQWRDDLGARLSSAGTRAVAVTRWDKALLLQGLAREAGIQATIAGIGNGLFRTELTA